MWEPSFVYHCPKHIVLVTIQIGFESHAWTCPRREAELLPLCQAYAAKSLRQAAPATLSVRIDLGDTVGRIHVAWFKLNEIIPKANKLTTSDGVDHHLRMEMHNTCQEDQPIRETEAHARRSVLERLGNDDRYICETDRKVKAV
ncbi:hypothetical protein MRX96_035090 [Rhipicephalus microplus]